MESRSITFENPTGERGGGGRAHDGRKGAPSRRIAPGERVVLADIAGPGVVRHIWLTIPPAAPEVMRAMTVEVFYDDADEPSVSTPCLDFFGLPHGRPVAFSSALLVAQEARGFNSYIPMPFGQRIRIEVANGADRPSNMYFQIDYTLQRDALDGVGLLHASFRRENPTTIGRDFVITEGLQGPGRFLGCNVGVRIIDDCAWWGEGEVKMYFDGDDQWPTICGTGLEDYVGTAWGLAAHAAPYGGAPLVVGPDPAASEGSIVPDFVGFYRWHVPDPVLFREDLVVTIQQIGAMSFRQGEEAELAEYERTNPPAGGGWRYDVADHLLAWGIAERVDDFCATAYVYCTAPQSVPRVDLGSAVADIGLRPYESAPGAEVIDAVFPPSSE